MRFRPAAIVLILLVSGVVPAAIQDAWGQVREGAAPRPGARGLLAFPAGLEVEGVPLKEALAALEHAAGVPLAYSPSRLPLERRVTCRCREATVGEAIEILLGGLAFEGSEVAAHLVIRESGPGLVPAPRRPAEVARPVRLMGRGEPSPRSRVRIHLLDPIEVEAERGSPALSGPLRDAYERAYRMRRLGVGRVIDREEIERRSPPSLTSLLSGVTGMRHVLGQAPGDWGVTARRPELSFSGLGSCPPALYLDGRRFRDPGHHRDRRVPSERELPEVDRVVHPRQVELVEVYRSMSEVPADFSGSEARCGVIAVWTRRW